MWPELPVPERQRLLASVIDSVFLRTGKGLPIEERVVIFPLGDGPADLPRRGHRVPLEPLPWPVDAPGHAGMAAA